MGWRSIIIDSPCKISVGGGYLIIRAEETRKIYLREIGYLMIACPTVNITGVAVCELTRQKIKVVFCDERRNPCAEVSGLYGCHNCAKKVRQQIAWDSTLVTEVNTAIVAQKIVNQARLLGKCGEAERAAMLEGYAREVVPGDESNREGHAAKVYFNTLFGLDFTRERDCAVNAALNYGYSVLLSLINREVVAGGRLTQLGLSHRNEFNEFNLSCDLMEPFRVLVDELVYERRREEFSREMKFALVDLMNKRVIYGREYVLADAVAAYVRNVFECLDSCGATPLRLYEFA